MKRMTTVEARNNFSDLINTVAYGENRIILTRRGKDLVAMVPLDDLERLEGPKRKERTSELRRTFTPRRRKLLKGSWQDEK